MWEWRTMAKSPALSSRMADGKEVQRPVQIVTAQSEVRGGDRRGEAIVEGLGQSQCLVDAVPAQPDRDLVHAQPARMEEPEHLDPLEVVFAERPELRRPVL